MYVLEKIRLNSQNQNYDFLQKQLNELISLKTIKEIESEKTEEKIYDNSNSLYTETDIYLRQQSIEKVLDQILSLKEKLKKIQDYSEFIVA